MKEINKPLDIYRVIDYISILKFERYITMNKREAHRLGVKSGYETAAYHTPCVFRVKINNITADELSNLDSFIEAGLQICENRRQYAGHPYEIISEEPVERRDGLYDAFDAAEIIGLRKYYLSLMNRSIWRRK